MRILVDENMSGDVVNTLTAAGHDVLWAKSEDPGADDIDLLNRATQEGRVLVTYDSDYGDLVHADRRPAPYGVLLFRIHDHVTTPVKDAFVAGSIMAWGIVPPGVWTIQIRHRLV